MSHFSLFGFRFSVLFLLSGLKSYIFSVINFVFLKGEVYKVVACFIFFFSLSLVDTCFIFNLSLDFGFTLFRKQKGQFLNSVIKQGKYYLRSDKFIVIELYCISIFFPSVEFSVFNSY